jgi:hypothetical protein
VNPRAREMLLVVIIASALATVSAFPILASIENWGIQDWDQHLFYNAVPRTTIIEYGQIPLWNPYSCGGTVLLAHPLSRVLSPFFPLHLVLGTVVAIKLEILLHLAIGLVGGYWLARAHGISRASSSLAAIVYMLSTMFALNLVTGMTSFLTIAYVPWAMFFMQRGLSRLRNLVGCATVLVLIYFEGGAQLLAITLLGMAIAQACAAVRERRWRPAADLVVVVTLTLLLGGVKFVPSIAFMASHPRPISDYSGFSVGSLLYSLLDRDQSVDAPVLGDNRDGLRFGFSWGMDENGMYVGYLSLALIVVGLVARGRREWMLTLLLVVFLWLSLGNRIRPSLWELLHSAPLFSMMRVSQRFRWVLLLVLALFAAFGLEAIRTFGRRRGLSPHAVSLVSAAIVLAVLADLTITDYRVWSQTFTIPPQPVERSAEFGQIASLPLYDANGPVRSEGDPPPRAAFSALYPALLGNRGVIDCYESAAVKVSALPRGAPGYQGEVELTGTGAARFRRWSPNRLDVEVTAHRPGLLIVNQNYDPDWRASGGKTVIEHGGRLAVAVTPEDRDIVLTYRPTGFIMGAPLSAATILVLVGLTVRRRRRGAAESDVGPRKDSGSVDSTRPSRKYGSSLV